MEMVAPSRTLKSKEETSEGMGKVGCHESRPSVFKTSGKSEDVWGLVWFLRQLAAGEAGRVNRTRPRRGGPMAVGSPDMLRTALLRVLERGLV